MKGYIGNKNNAK